MKTLICYDGLKDTPKEKLPFSLDLRQTEVNDDELMDVYESIEPSLIGKIRNQIIDLDPDVIVVIGTSESYRWLATVVCRIFGNFNAWLHQRHLPKGQTVININGRKVPLFAYDSWEEWRAEHEETH